MRLLLDTQVLFWVLVEPHRLTPLATDIVGDPANQVYVSAATAWELSVKHTLGKLPVAGPVVAGYSAHLVTLRAEELAVTSAHALRAGSYRLHHRDPFDRLLAAQASLEGLTLVTQDQVFAAFPDLSTIW